MTFRAHRAAGVAAVAAMLCAGCASMSESPLTSWMTWIPAPSFAWLTGGSRKPGPLPQLEAKVTPRIA